MNIYVGNLSYDVEESELKKIFEEYGEVTTAKIVTDKYTRRSKGFGFIVMENSEEAEKAIGKLNGIQLENREIVVNEARPKSENFFR